MLNVHSVVRRQAQLQQGHEDYQSVARREQREQERRRADQARDAERKTREEVCRQNIMCLIASIMGTCTALTMGAEHRLSDPIRGCMAVLSHTQTANIEFINTCD